MSPIRKGPGLVIFGIVIFDDNDITKIAPLIDGQVDIILADAEKKIPISVKHNPQMYVSTGNLSKTALICFKNS